MTRDKNKFEIAQPVDVFFRGGRNYIQGSLITSRVLETLTQHHGRETIGVERVRFKTIKDTRVAIVSTASGGLNVFGDIFCSIDGSTYKFYLVEVDGPKPERIEDSPSQIIEYANNGHMSCVAKIRKPESFDEIMSAIIETVKKCVTKSFDGASDIWFTEMSHSNLKILDSSLSNDDIVITVVNEAELIRMNRIMTRSNVKINFGNSNFRNAKIVFTHLDNKGIRE